MRHYTVDTEEEVLKLAASAFGDASKLDFHRDSWCEALEGLVPFPEFANVPVDDLYDRITYHQEMLLKDMGFYKKTGKIIFLDIDGVLNHQSMTKENEIKTEGGFVSKECVKLLNHITSETGAQIVISSTWRMDGFEDDGVTPKTKAHLESAGVTGEIIDNTPILRDAGNLRGNEIRCWLQANRPSLFSDYIILDDDSDMLYWQKENYFHVDHFIGITPNVAFRAVNFLKKIKDERYSP